MEALYGLVGFTKLPTCPGQGLSAKCQGYRIITLSDTEEGANLEGDPLEHLLKTQAGESGWSEPITRVLT